MTTKKFLNAGLLTAGFCLALSAWAVADTTTTTTPTSNDKMGSNANPSYNTGTPDNTATSDTKNETKTVPSGKRHRTHKKHGNDAQSADANKTINATDVTPSK